MAELTYKYVGTHAQDLPGGRVVAPGEGGITIPDGDRSEWHGLLNDGLLVEEEEAQPEATEAAVKLAKKLDVQIANVKGTGKDGIATVEDVQKAADAAKEGEEE